jgi:predicted nucleotidyltransferase
MNKIISEKIEDIKKLCVNYDVKSLYLFGSALRANLDDSSDIDLLISFNNISIDKYTNNYFELHDKFQSLFNRQIDLITENQLSNPFFIQKVEESKILLYIA